MRLSPNCAPLYTLCASFAGAVRGPRRRCKFARNSSFISPWAKTEARFRAIPLAIIIARYYYGRSSCPCSFSMPFCHSLTAFAVHTHMASFFLKVTCHGSSFFVGRYPWSGKPLGHCYGITVHHHANHHPIAFYNQSMSSGPPP